MQRILIYDREKDPVGELAPEEVLSATLHEAINGEHALEITTTRVLDKGLRLLHQDARGKWREFAVVGVDAMHTAGDTVVGHYYCPWSLQEDLMGVTVSVMPGVQTPVTAATALTSLLSSQARWAVGTVTNTATGGASMYDRSAWEALSTLVDVWGGEVDASITVNLRLGVESRSVCLYAAQGDQTAKRRFDFGADVRGIVRTLSDEPLYCRISPRGKGEETDAGGYGRKITIASVNSGRDYLEYQPMVSVARILGSSYLYPTKIIENPDMETPAELKTWAESVLARECTPKVGYEIDVLQSDMEGTSVQGVSLGDAVNVVDAKFGAGVRIEARVVEMTTDLVAERVESIKLGDPKDTLSAKFEKVSRAVQSIENTMTTMATAQYVDELLERINTEINATGGYTYITEGQGLRTYDRAVSDPLVGSEATQVVEIKGGNIRIANSKTSQGAWNWQTVLQSGHIAAALITAANITAGRIGAANSKVYFDLDNNELHCDMLVSTASGSKTTVTVASVPAYSSGSEYGMKVVNSAYANGMISLAPAVSSTSGGHSLIRSPVRLETMVGTWGETSAQGGAVSARNFSSLDLYGTGTVGVVLKSRGGINLDAPNSSLIQIQSKNVQLYCRNGGGFDVVVGTKSKVVETDNYSQRRLYCYETPSPVFADIGSGTIGEDGTCIVEIDDVFSETVRTDIAYQVFLQRCGQGDAWIAEKHPRYFVVEGEPGLQFDWEIKARQAGFEHLRLEQMGLDEEGISDRDTIPNPEDMYPDYIEEIEQALYA